MPKTVAVSGDEQWPASKPVPSTGVSKETPSVSPAVWAKEKPAKRSRSSPRPSADGPQPSSAEEPDAAVLSIVMLMPGHGQGQHLHDERLGRKGRASEAAVRLRPATGAERETAVAADPQRRVEEGSSGWENGALEQAVI